MFDEGGTIVKVNVTSSTRVEEYNIQHSSSSPAPAPATMPPKPSSKSSMALAKTDGDDVDTASQPSSQDLGISVGQMAKAFSYKAKNKVNAIPNPFPT